MMPLYGESTVLFRQIPGKGPYGSPVNKTKNKAEEESSDNGEHIRCRQCHLIITEETERIQVNGTHQHVCANPSGIVFEIGCFRTAGGCNHVGPSSSEWSWFPGFSWKISVCNRCMIHLGWFFTASTPDSFYGLILNRLIATH